MKRRSNQPPRRYERSGYLALEPKAFLEFFMVPETRENEEIDGVAIVDICGPLDQHDDGWCDSYDAIRARVKLACESPARAVVLRIDSPGGDCAGCFDAGRALRAECERARKPLVAYIDKACSAGYALACAAQQVVLSDTALVGSIGVICTRDDMTALNASRGIRVALITSGARKADGHPDSPITDAELKETQRIVDSLAQRFFSHVGEMRAVTPGEVEALDARTYHGDAAIAARLADVIEPLDATIARLSRGEQLTTQEIAPMAASYEKVRDALAELAQGEDANAAAAKRALAELEKGHAEEGGDKPADDKPKPPDAEGGDKKPDAEGDDKKPEAEGDDKKPEAESDDDKPQAKSPTLVSLAAEVHKLRAERAEEKLRAERKQLLDGRPDLAPELRAVLERAPIETVRDTVKSLPRDPSKATSALASVTGTRGEGQGKKPEHAEVDMSDPDRPMTAAELDRRMGLEKREGKVVKTATRLTFTR